MNYFGQIGGFQNIKNLFLNFDKENPIPFELFKIVLTFVTPSLQLMTPEKGEELAQAIFYGFQIRMQTLSD